MTYRFLLAVLLAVFASCDRAPMPDASWLPDIVDVSVEPGVYSAVLSAKVKGDTHDGCEYGFYFGTTETDLQKIQSPCQDGVVSTSLTDLLPNTKYFFKAYASNGRVEACSNIMIFKTLPETPAEPEGTDRPSDQDPPVDSGDSSEADPQPVTEVYYMHCPHIFRSTLYGPKIPGADVILSCRWLDEDGTPSSDYVDIWIYAAARESKGSRLYISGTRNESFNDRTVELLLQVQGTSDAGVAQKRMVKLVVIQHSYLSSVHFESPAVESRCIELWDKNSDGRLTYAEVDEVTSSDALGKFTGSDMTSFNEFALFHQITTMLPNMFEGSGLKEITLPLELRVLSQGAFRNCASLEYIDLSGKVLAQECFMGCTSLKAVNPYWNFVPDKAFSGCTSLLKCVIENNEKTGTESYIGIEAFKGCISLQEVRLPQSIRQINSSAFEGCTSLSGVYFTSANPPELAPDAFENTSPALHLYVPSPIVSLYTSAWPHLAERIVAY